MNEASPRQSEADRDWDQEKEINYGRNPTIICVDVRAAHFGLDVAERS